MEILYLVAAVVALVWGSVLLRRTGLFGACVAMIPLAACFSFDFIHFDVGPLSLSCDRLAWMALGVVYLVFRGLRWTESPPLDRVDNWLGAFLLMLAANTLLHDFRFNHAKPLVNLMLLYGMPAAIFWFVRESKFGERALVCFFGLLGAFSLYLAATAVAEVANATAFIFPRYIITSSFTEWLGRGRGPFLNPVANGMYMITGLCALSTFWPRVGALGKAALAAAMVAVSLGIYCTLTRSCWIGAAASLGLIALSAMSKHWRPPVVVGGALAAACLVLFTGDRFTSFKRDRDVSEHEMSQSASLRPMLAIVAVKIARDHPLFGCGYGLYRKVNVDYLHDPDIDYPLHRVAPFVQHNVVLALLAETGIVGAGLYVALLAGWFHRAWSLWSRTQISLAFRQSGLLFASFLVHWMIQGMFHDTSLMVNANLLMFLLAGMSQALFSRTDDDALTTAIDPQPVAC